MVAHWGGDFKYPGQFEMYGEVQHVFSLLPEATSTRGAITLIQHENLEEERIYRVFNEGISLVDAEPLYARVQKSVPPFQAFCLYGSLEVEHWLREQGHSRLDYWDLAHEHEDHYNEVVGFEPWVWWSAEDVALVLDPWPMMWPDDEVYPIPPARLVAGSLRDTEPFVQLWHSASSQGWWAEGKHT